MSKSKNKTAPAAKPSVKAKTDNRNAPPKRSKTKGLSAEDQATLDALASSIECETIAVETVIDKTAREDAEMEALLSKMDEDAIDASLLASEDIETITPINAEEVYASMTSELTVAEPTDEEAKPRKSAGRKPKEKRETVKSGESAPKRAIDPHRLASIVGEAEAARLIAGASALPVKVRDKAVNAVAAITNGVRMSGYTQLAIEHLRKAEDNVSTATGIVGMFRDRGYSPGTAAAQAQQQMVLLDYLGIAKREGRSIRLNTSNPLTVAVAA